MNRPVKNKITSRFPVRVPVSVFCRRPCLPFCWFGLPQSCTHGFLIFHATSCHFTPFRATRPGETSKFAHRTFPSSIGMHVIGTRHSFVFTFPHPAARPSRYVVILSGTVRSKRAVAWCKRKAPRRYPVIPSASPAPKTPNPHIFNASNNHAGIIC